MSEASEARAQNLQKGEHLVCFRVVLVFGCYDIFDLKETLSYSRAHFRKPTFQMEQNANHVFQAFAAAKFCYLQCR